MYLMSYQGPLKDWSGFASGGWSVYRFKHQKRDESRVSVSVSFPSSVITCWSPSGRAAYPQISLFRSMFKLCSSHLIRCPLQLQRGVSISQLPPQPYLPLFHSLAAPPAVPECRLMLNVLTLNVTCGERKAQRQQTMSPRLQRRSAMEQQRVGPRQVSTSLRCPSLTGKPLEQ